VSYVGFGVGAAALVGSALLFFAAPSDEGEPSQAASLELSPALAPGLAGLSVSGAF